MKRFLFAAAVLLILGCSGMLHNSFRPSPGKHFTEPGHDSIARNLFIDDSFFVAYKMKRDANGRRMRIWSNFIDKQPPFIQVYDIRWEFDTNKDAAAAYKTYLERNSEGDKPLHTRLKIEGTDDLNIYVETAKMAAMTRSMLKFTMHHYNFIFRIDNVVAKVFVATNEDTRAEDAIVFARTAAKTIQAAHKK